MASSWTLFISHLPSREGTLRMRLWRALRGLGAGILRDGVYLLPTSAAATDALEAHAGAVRAAGGSAHLLGCEPSNAREEAQFRALFDRRAEYTDWHQAVVAASASLTSAGEPKARREEANLRRALEDIRRTDFFPGAAGSDAEAAMTAHSQAINACYSPDEPHATAGEIILRDATQYSGRTWATRAGLWIDRVASAWLIVRCIDSHARFAWIAAGKQCPADAVGFDFDGAEFSHVGERVTFEVLLAAFGLQQDASLRRLGALVHYLDVGGAPVAEAPGVLALLGAARERCAADDAFLAAATPLLDDLRLAFEPKVEA